MDWIAHLAEATGRFATELEDGDLAADVPACPGWTLTDLGEHLRVTHLWSAHAVTAGNPDGTPAPGPRDRTSLVAGYRAAAAHIVDVLTSTPADAEVWAFGPKPRLAAFWQRRQAHEAWMHLYDALAAAGRESEWDVAPDLAWDGVDEVVTMFYPRQLRRGRSEPVAGTLRLRATDVDRALDLGEGEPVVEVEDTAARLLLVLWGRVPAPTDAAGLLAGATVTP